MTQHALLPMARRLVAQVLAEAHTRGLRAREQRRRIRAVFAATIIPAHVRYLAVRLEAGVSMLDLSDARQPLLLDRGPRRRVRRTSRRRKTIAHVA